LAQAGAAVLIGDVRQEQARTVADELSRSCDARVISTGLDVTDDASVAAAAVLTESEFGGLDIWVNNAGIYPNVPLLDMSVEVWDKVLEINLRGVFLGAREAARRMIARGRGGVIINVASTAGVKGQGPKIAAYVASKTGVIGLTRQLAIELGPHGIRVLGVAPTYCDTEGTRAPFANAHTNPNIQRELPALAGSWLGRIGVPDDVGRAALFCASDMSMFMTGSTVMVDAGETS
jgi:NAD(P)-dependent dehydrogenase (short-subunit alcohol dehydrogenase family)